MTPALRGLPWADWLAQQRWYAGRTRTLDSATVHAVIPLGAGLDDTLVDANYTDGTTERYQVVVQWDSGPNPEYAADATIGSSGEHTAYDAQYRMDSAQRLLSLIDKEPGAVLPDGAASRVLGGEQSNTCVVVDEQVILKLFRRVVCGINPDIELTRVLGRAGSPHIAPLLGTFGTVEDCQEFSLAMVSAFAADAVNGWDLAIGAGFDGQSYGLGEAVGSVHTTLASELGTSAATVPVDRFRTRLDAAVTDVPELAKYRAAIEERYIGLTGVPITVQRVHGDLHLGQVLRTPAAWLLIDFEGEPGQPLPQRRQPDSPLRDVAGMLRSFDYAGHGERAEFCEGYAVGSGMDPRAQSEVLAGYELDKAVYEARYEARHRPEWLHIPLQAIAQLVG